MEVAEVDATRGERAGGRTTISGSSSGRIGRMRTVVTGLDLERRHHTASGRGGWPAAAASSSVTSGSCSDDAGVEGDQAVWRGQQRVDVDLLDPALLDDQLAEAHEQLLERRRGRPARGRARP